METALGALLVASLVLGVLILPSALIDTAAGTKLLGPVATALLLVLSAGAVLGMAVIWQGRYSDDKSERRLSDKTAGNGAADRDYKKDWRRR